MKQFVINTQIALLGLLTRVLRVAYGVAGRRSLVLLNENTADSFECLGDQATMRGMVAGYREADPDATLYTVSHREDKRWRDVPGIAGVVPMGRPMGLGRAWRLIRHTAAAKHVQYLGGDSVDGKYGVGPRYWALRFYAWAGVPLYVTSFSFNESPTQPALDLLAGLPRSARFLVRDARSIERFTRLTGRPHVAVADAAFMLPPDDTQVDDATRAFIAAQRDAGRMVVGLNLNDKVIPGAPDAEAVQAAVRELAAMVDAVVASRPVAWVTLPHDVRGVNSDVNIARWIAEAVAPESRPHVHAAPLMASGGVKSTAALLDLVVTGRMHLAIASLGVGTPVLSFTYQDKFEGLFDYFGFQGITLDPADGMTAARVLPFVEQGLDRRDELAGRVAAHLAEVQAMARRNVLVGDAGNGGA